MILAIFSPNQNAYSETFIRAHRQLPYDIKFYYGGNLPNSLENISMAKLPLRLRILKKITRTHSFLEKRLQYSLKKEKVQVVLIEYGPTAVESLKPLKNLRIPIVVHFHGFDASKRDVINIYKERYVEVFEYASYIIAVSNKMKKDLMALKCPESKIVVNPCGPKKDFFDLEPTYDSQQFISVGRFVEKKASHLTILAFKKILTRYPNAKLKMIGGGPFWNVCMDLVKHLDLSNNIEIVGVKSPQEVQNYMEQSLAFVQHSVVAHNGDSEGTPVAVLEAQAAKLPVISTYHAGIPDVVIDGVTGLLSQERDIDAMAENMIKVLSDHTLAKTMGEAGRKRVRENFSIEKHLKILENCINVAMDNSGRN